jgi:tape measure domain-containing protein
MPDIKVRLDIDSAGGSQKATNDLKRFSDLGQQEMKRLADSAKAARKAQEELAKSLGITFTQLTNLRRQYDSQAKAAERTASTEAREAQRAANARIRESNRAAKEEERNRKELQRFADKAAKDNERNIRNQEREMRNLARTMQQIENQSAKGFQAKNYNAALTAQGIGPAFGQVSSQLAGGVIGRAVGGGLFGGGGGVIGGLLGSAGGGGSIGASLAGLSVPVIGAMVAGIFAVIKAIDLARDATSALISNWLEYRQIIDRATVSMSAFTGSIGSARALVIDLQKSLGGLADLDSLFILTRRLAGAGIELNKIKQIATDLTTLQLAFGLDNQEVKRLAKALGDVAAAGRLRGQEVNQFTNAGVPIRNILADSLQVSPAQVKKLITDGKVTLDQVLTALNNEAKKRGGVLQEALILPEVSSRRISVGLGELVDRYLGGFYDEFKIKFKELADIISSGQDLFGTLELAGVYLANVGGTWAGQIIGGMIDYFSSPGNIAGLISRIYTTTTALSRTFALSFGKAVVDAINPFTQPAEVGIIPKENKPKRNPNENDLDKQPGGKTIFDRLRDAQKRLSSFQNLGSPENTARFEIEGIERTTRDYEKILNLRYELGQVLTQPLPEGREQIKQYVEGLEAEKRVADAVKRANEDVKRSTEELIIAIKSEAIPVTQAQTLFNIEYSKSIRERNIEEQKGIAALASAVQQRIDIASDEKKALQDNTILRTSLYKSVLDSAEAGRKEFETARLTKEAFEANTDILEELDKLNVKLASSGNDVGETFKILSAEIGFASTYLDGKLLPALAKMQLETIDLTAEILILTEREKQFGDASTQSKLKSLELTKRLKESNIELKESIREAAIEEEVLRNRLENYAKNGSEDIARQTAENDILQRQIDAKDTIISLQEEIASASEGSADRYEIAWLEAIKEVQDANEDAVKRQIRAQVQIAEQTQFNAERAKAIIAENVASAKGYTEIFADAFINVTDGISNGIGRLLDKATEKLGLFGDVISNIAQDLLKMVTNRLMMQLVNALLGGGLSGAPGVAAPSGGSGFASGGVGLLGGLFGGGGVGGFLTPGFAGGYPTISQQAFSTQGLNSALDRAFGSGSLDPSSATRPRTVGVPPLSLGASLGKTLGAAAPFLGFSLGSALGGTSTPGSFLGGLGGAAVAGFGAASAGLLGTGAIAGLFSNPITAAVGGALLIGGYFLGKAKQRGVDEQAADELVAQFRNRIVELTIAVNNDQISGSEALSEFQKNKQETIDAIRTQIKTKSVIQSRINNSINSGETLQKENALREAVSRQDQRKSEAAALEARRQVNREYDSRLVPEFHSGGIVGLHSNEILAKLEKGEIVINRSQQTPEVLSAARDAGVPGVSGGNTRNSGSQPIYVELVLGTDTQNQLFVNGAKSSQGLEIIVKQSNKGISQGRIIT